LDLQDHKELLDHKDHRAYKDLPARLVRKASQDLLDLQDLKVTLEQPLQYLVLLVHREKLDLQDHREKLDLQDQLDLQVIQDLQVP
jgi:hypothetical protein